jgi:hypothetical protein
MRAIDCARVLADDGTDLGRPTLTLYRQAYDAERRVWAYPHENEPGVWCAFPPENRAPWKLDPEARLVTVR